jgi:hypothetical protein
MAWLNPLGRFIDGQKKSTRDGEVRGATCWGQLRHARCAYDVVSFLPTQMSSTRLVVFAEKGKCPGLQTDGAVSVYCVQTRAADKSSFDGH